RTFLLSLLFSYVLFFFHYTATPEIYTLSLHDALPICSVLFGCVVYWPQAQRDPAHVVARGSLFVRIARWFLKSAQAFSRVQVDNRLANLLTRGWQLVRAR